VSDHEGRRDRILAREAKRLSRSTKAVLIGQILDGRGREQELEAKIEELTEIIVDLEIRLDLDGRNMGPIERRIDEIAAKVVEPSAKQLAHLEIARNLARILDRGGGENERSAASTAKQLDVEIVTVWASIEDQEKPKKGLGILHAVQ